MATDPKSSSGYEIPNEMRDLAEKSVEQARKAFDSFMEAAHKASAALESQADAAHSQARSVGGAVVSYAEQNMAASFAYAQDLLRASSPEQLLKIQADFAKAQIETLTRQVKDLGAMAGRRPDAKK
jgi:phasin